MKVFWLICLLISTSLAEYDKKTTEIKLLSIGECDVEDGAQPYEYDIELKEIADNIFEADLSLKIPEEVTDEFSWRMDIKKWDDGKWQDYNVVDGNLWDDISQYVPRVYEKLADIAEPKFPDSPPIPADTYIVKGFQVYKDDMDLPTMIEGRFKVKFLVYSQSDWTNNVICKEAEFDTKV